MIVTFVGHSVVDCAEKVEKLVKEIIIDIVDEFGGVICYLGYNGDFDKIFASACRDLKKEYNIKVVYVTPYISLSEQSKIKQMQNDGLCDTSLYPSLERVPPRFAIPRRNEWMVKHADLIISYIRFTYGGAYKTFLVAKRNKKKVINIFELLKFPYFSSNFKEIFRLSVDNSLKIGYHLMERKRG